MFDINLKLILYKNYLYILINQSESRNKREPIKTAPKIKANSLYHLLPGIENSSTVSSEHDT